MPKLPVVSAVLLLVLLPAQPAPPTFSPSTAEFPPQDQQISILQRRGLTARLAAQRLAEAPASVETIRLLAEAENLDGLLRALRTIVDGEPRLIADAFEAAKDASWRFRGDQLAARDRTAALKQIVAGGRARLPELPREEAARAERIFVMLDVQLTPDLRRSWPAQLARFRKEFSGTEAARLTAIDEIVSGGRISRRTFDELQAIVDAHPGTTVAAKALYQQGFQWHTINTLGTLEPRGADPIRRFERVLTIVGELESGRYPPSEWVEKAPSLVMEFFIPDVAAIAPKSVDRFLAVFEAYARKAFDDPEPLHAQYPANSGVGYLVTSRMADLFGKKGDRITGVERVLDRLERRAAEPSAVRYLRALFYLRPQDDQKPADRDRLEASARRELAALAAAGTGLYHRKALATLANLDFASGDYTAARQAYRQYAGAYPQSEWAWVALLRAGHCEEALGNAQGAAALYLDAATRYGSLPTAYVLGHEYAALLFEAEGDLERALAHHRRALDGWDNAFGIRYSTFAPRPRPTGNPFELPRDPWEVQKEALAPRIARVEQVLHAPGGARLERGRALLTAGRYDEAAAALREVAADHPDSAVAAEARSLERRARLERALQLANVERPDHDEAAAIRELEVLAGEPVDFAVTAARLARASLFWKAGDWRNAEAGMRKALTDWHEQQSFVAPASGLESDVAEIRRVVFRPRGGGVYEGHGWNAFRWPPAAPFLLVNTDIRVKMHDGEVLRLALPVELDASGTVLFFDTEQIERLKGMVSVLGGTRRRTPTQVMETPNQPVGDSMQILKLWNRYFAARPGHWAGWEIETYPLITEIQFADAARTKASAHVTIGYSGAAVELEKEDGKWFARRLTGFWIT